MILIALGANLPSAAGGPAETLDAALLALKTRGIVITKKSRFYRSPAWPDASHPEFVNAVARIETDLAPFNLLQTLHRIEREFGRKPTERNAPRPLDLDLLDYCGRVEKGPLELPHPRLQERLFVLLPLQDVAPRWRHPIGGQTVQKLIAALPDSGIEPLGPD